LRPAVFVVTVQLQVENVVQTKLVMLKVVLGVLTHVLMLTHVVVVQQTQIIAGAVVKMPLSCRILHMMMVYTIFVKDVAMTPLVRVVHILELLVRLSTLEEVSDGFGEVPMRCNKIV